MSLLVVWIQSLQPFRLRVEYPTERQLGEGDLETGFSIDIKEGMWKFDSPTEQGDYVFKIGQTRDSGTPPGTSYPYAVLDGTNLKHLTTLLTMVCEEAEGAKGADDGEQFSLMETTVGPGHGTTQFDDQE